MLILMIQEGTTNIDESIKVKSWDADCPSPQTNQQSFFQKYAAHLPEPSYSRPHIGYEHQSDLNQMDTAFRQLKNNQIQKLRNLKSEYEDIRRITIDYNMPRFNQDSSVRSSGIKTSSPASQIQKVKGHGFNGGRENQILQLQKKQLEIMLENSMKKIEQLLHSQMQHKKLLHELQLEKESKYSADNDSSTVKKIFKKKQKELYDQIKILELERQTLFSQSTSLKEKVKFLESKLHASQQELRKLLLDKRDYEQLLLNEKNKFMNLSIDYQREKREFQIMEKDKNAQIQHLLRSKDIKESSADKELKQTNAHLQEQLKTKEKRYILLLQQIDNIQKQSRQEKQSQEQQVKIVNQLLSKSSADASNKALQQTLNGILLRLADLQTKPQPISHLLSDLINVEKKDQAQGVHIQEVDLLQKKIQYLEQKVNSQNHNNSILQAQNSSLKVQISSLSRKNRTLQDSQTMLKDQIERLRHGEKKLAKETSRDKVGIPPKEDSSSKVNLLLSKISNLESQIQSLNAKLEESEQERQRVDEQNRSLLTKISKIQFQMNKTKQEADFQTNLTRKELETTIGILQKEVAAERGLHNGAKNQINQLRFYVQQSKGSESQEVQALRKKVESLQREIKSYDTQMKQRYNSDIEAVNKDYQNQIDQLTTKIKDLSLANKDLQEQYNRQQFNKYDAFD